MGKSGGVVWWSGEGYGGFIGGDGSEVVHAGGGCYRGHRCRIIGQSTLLWIRGEEIFVIFSHSVKYVTANFLLFKKIIIIIIML